MTTNLSMINCSALVIENIEWLERPETMMIHHDIDQKWQSGYHIINDCRSQIDILIMSTAIREIAKPNDTSQPPIAPMATDMQPAMICYVRRTWVHFRMHVRAKPDQGTRTMYRSVPTQ
jgi:hypothetical protein